MGMKLRQIILLCERSNSLRKINLIKSVIGYKQNYLNISFLSYYNMIDSRNLHFRFLFFYFNLKITFVLKILVRIRRLNGYILLGKCILLELITFMQRK